MLAISCKKGGGDSTTPTYFRIDKTDSQTALVRSALSTNNTSPAGTSNVQNIYVDIAERSSQNFSVSILSAQTNNAGDIKDFVSFTNRGSRYFLVVNDEIFTNTDGSYLIKADSTTPLTVNYRVAATGSGYTGATSYDYAINGTLQYANIISNATGDRSISNALRNANNSFGENVFYTNTSTNKSKEDVKFEFANNNFIFNDKAIIFTNAHNNYGGNVKIDGTLLKDLIMTNGNYTNYFSDITASFTGNTPASSPTAAEYNLVFVPHYTNEVEKGNEYTLKLDDYTNKID